jgi:hypothetical protein
MALSDSLPSDSVLRRHAQTERNRILGLPPTDAVLRRHFDQWQAALRDRAEAAAPPAGAPARAPVAAQRPAAAVLPSTAAVLPPVAAATAPMASRPMSATPARTGGGFFGWLRRLVSG